jgi:hypothetical protein
MRDWGFPMGEEPKKGDYSRPGRMVFGPTIWAENTTIEAQLER